MAVRNISAWQFAAAERSAAWSQGPHSSAVIQRDFASINAVDKACGRIDPLNYASTAATSTDDALIEFRGSSPTAPFCQGAQLEWEDDVFEDDDAFACGFRSEENDQYNDGCQPAKGFHAPSASQPLPQGCTTLMVRNIPPIYTQEMLADEWADSGSFDFVYLPRRGNGRSHVGYAFVNFCTEEDAAFFRTRWQKVGLARSSSRKILNVSVAGVQGLHANLLQLAKKCQTVARQPLIFLYGRRFGLDEALEVMEQRSCPISV